ncbi:MAG: hypothetical protein AAF959_01510 [Cyanobacteria bacterium P01_D01_bin.56]
MKNWQLKRWSISIVALLFTLWITLQPGIANQADINTSSIQSNQSTQLSVDFRYLEKLSPENSVLVMVDYLTGLFLL